MDLAKQPLGEHHGYHYFSVDAFALRSRSLADEEFSNVATHHDIAAVPKNEVWLDNRLKPEFRFLIAEAAERLKLLARGTDAVHAYEGGLAVARSMREKASGRPHLGRDKHETKAAIPAEVYAGPEFKFKDYRVRFVDGRVVRDLFKTDFSQGGNPEEYPFIPKGELWVEQTVDKREVPMVVEHEYHECELMKKGHGYDTAHPAASRREWQMRNTRGPRKYSEDVTGIHRALSNAPTKQGGGPMDLGAWKVLSDALIDAHKPAASELAQLISQPTRYNEYTRYGGWNDPPEILGRSPAYDPDNTIDWQVADDGEAEMNIGGLPVVVTHFRPWRYGDGGQMEPHAHRPDFYEAHVGRHPKGTAPGSGRLGGAVIPAEHVARLMDEADSLEGQIPYWHEVEENRVSRENRPREPHMPDPERFQRRYARPDDLFARILAHPGARRFGLTRELLSKMPPQAIQDMVKQLGIATQEPQPKTQAKPQQRPLTQVMGELRQMKPAAPEKPALPVAQQVPLQVRHHPEVGLHLPVAEQLPEQGWFGREMERFKSDISPLTDAAKKVGNLVRRQLGVPEKQQRAGDPERYATLAGIPGEEALYPAERARIESFAKGPESTYKSLIERSMEDRPGPSVGMPRMSEIKVLGRAGAVARGGYRLGGEIADHLFGHDDEARVAWAGTNSIFSANTDVPQHTGAATVTVARWMAAGKPSNRRRIEQILKRVGEIRKVNDVGETKLAYPTARMGDHFNKAADLLQGIGEIAKSHEALTGAIAKSGIGKTPNFGLAFLSALGIPIDTHMLKAVTPEGLHKTIYGRDLIRHVIGQAGLGPMSQAESREHYNSDLMKAIAEHGGVRAMSVLKQFNDDMFAKPQFFLAYKSLLAQAARDFGWEPREMQEAVWTGLLGTIALRDLGVPPERVAQAMLHDANLAGWNPITSIFRPEVVDELTQSGVRPRDLDRVKHAFDQARAAGPTGRVFTRPQPALADVAGRVTPSFGKSKSVDPVRKAYESLTGGGNRLTSLTGRRMARDGQPIRYRAVYQPHPALTPDHHALLNKTYARFKLHPSRKTLQNHAAALTEAINSLGTDGSPGTMRQQQHLNRQLHRSKAFLGSLALAMKLEREGEPQRYAHDEEEEEPREYKPGEYVSDREGSFHPEEEPDLAEFIRNRFAHDYGVQQPGDPVTKGTGYILPDGTPVNMGDFSTRHEDHRAAIPFSSAMKRWGWPADVVKSYEEASRGPALNELLRRSGAIRFMPERPMAHSEKPWTKAQLAAVERYMQRSGEPEIELMHLGHLATVKPHEIESFLRKPRKARFARALPDWVPKEEEGRESETGFVPVKSSWIAGLKLTPDDRGVSMIVKRGGKTYPYPGFGLKEFRQWVKAVSPGGWWWRHIGWPMMGQPRQKNVVRPLPPDKRPKSRKVEFARPDQPRRYAGHVGNPDLNAFVRAIGENPQDMAPKLIFADWLDEHAMPHTGEMFRNPKLSPNPPSEYNPGLFQNGVSIGAFRADPFYSFALPFHWMNVHGHGRIRDRGGHYPGEEPPIPGIRFHLHADDPVDSRLATTLLDHFETDPAKAHAILREIGGMMPMHTSFLPGNTFLQRMHRETPEDMVRDVFGVDPHQLQRLQRPGKARKYAASPHEIAAFLSSIAKEKTPGVGRQDQAPSAILADYLEDHDMPAHARMIRQHLATSMGTNRQGSGVNRRQTQPSEGEIHSPGPRGDLIRFMLLHPGRFVASRTYHGAGGPGLTIFAAPPVPRTKKGSILKGYKPELISFHHPYADWKEGRKHYDELIREGAIGQDQAVAQNWPERGIGMEDRPRIFERAGQPIRMAQQQMAQSFAQALRTLTSPNVQAFGDAVKSAYDEAGVQGETVPVIHDTPENSRPSILGLLRGKPTPPQTLYAAAWHGIMSKSPAMEAFVAGDGPDSLLSIAMPGSAGYAREVLNHIGVSPRLIRPDENFNEVVIRDPGRQLKDRIVQLGLPVRELTGKSVRLDGMRDYRAVLREYEAKTPQQQTQQQQEPQRQEEAQPVG